MANKVISEEELRDDYLSGLIRSEEPVQAPEGFMDDVMNRISLVNVDVKLQPYSPPVWFKWGVPGIIICCLVVLLIWSPVKQPVKPVSGVSLFEETFNTINSWISGFNPDIRVPSLDLSSIVLWILVGGIVLTWSFWLLSRFLEKKVRQ